MQTAGGGLQVIRSVEFQERGEAGKHIAHLVTPSMLLSFFVVIVIWLCVGEKGRNEKSSSFGGKRRWVHILGNCFSNAASWIYYDAGDDCQSWPLQASQVFRIVLSCDGLRKKEVTWYSKLTATLARWSGDWETSVFDLSRLLPCLEKIGLIKRHLIWIQQAITYRLPGNIFAVLFKYGFRFPAQVSWSLAKGCILSYRPTSWTIPWPPITNPVTYAVIMHPKADPITNAILDTMTVFCLLLKPLSNLFWTKIVYIISDIRQSNDQTGSAMFNNRLWCRWYLLLILPLPNQIMMIDQNKVHPTIRQWWRWDNK